MPITTGDDLIDGDSSDDSIDALAGNDTVIGYEGNDTIHGNDGKDSLVGNLGNDSLIGGKGADSVHAGGGEDTVDGGEGNDWLKGMNGNDLVYGGQGNDTVQGGFGGDTIWGGIDSDRLIGDELPSGNSLSVYAFSGAGASIPMTYSLTGDWLTFGQGVTGGRFSAELDYFSESSTSESLLIDAGAMNVNTATFTLAHFYLSEGPNGAEKGHWQALDDGNNVVAESDFYATAGSGAFTLNIDPGVHFQKVLLTAMDNGERTKMAGDRLDNSDYTVVKATATLDALPDNSRLGGNDLIYGEDGNDTILGQVGNDTLIGDDGDGTDGLSDLAITGKDANGNVVALNYNAPHPTPPYNNPIIDFTGGNVNAGRFAGELDYIYATNSSETITFDFDQTVNYAKATLAHFYSTDEGGPEKGVWDAYDGDGNLVNTGSFTATNANGNFSFEISGFDFEKLVLSATDNGHHSGKIVNGVLDNSDYTLKSVEFNPYTSNDSLQGGTGNDSMDGGWGNDTLIGGAGDDTMDGGNGADIFVFSGDKASDLGHDVIENFEDGADKFDIRYYHTDWATVQTYLSTSGSDAVASSPAGWSVVIEGAAGQIDASDFIF